MEIKVLSLADIYALSPRSQEEEMEYRRGYRDGWIEAANFIFDVWFRGKQRVYDLTFDHWQGALNEWRKGAGYLPPHPEYPRCVYCGAPAKHMDHVIPKSRGGPDTADNLVPACVSCNVRKNNRTPEEWRRGLRRPSNQSLELAPCPNAPCVNRERGG